MRRWGGGRRALRRGAPGLDRCCEARRRWTRPKRPRRTDIGGFAARVRWPPADCFGRVPRPRWAFRLQQQVFQQDWQVAGAGRSARTREALGHQAGRRPGGADAKLRRPSAEDVLDERHASAPHASASERRDPSWVSRQLASSRSSASSSRSTTVSRTALWPKTPSRFGPRVLSQRKIPSTIAWVELTIRARRSPRG